MPRESHLAVALALLVLLAGCNTFGAPGTQRDPFDVDEPTTTAGDQQNSSPVIAFDPLQNTTPEPWALLEAHFNSLEGRAYAVNYTSVQRAENGTIVTADNWSTIYGSDHETGLQTWTARRSNRQTGRQLYTNGTHVWIRSIANDSNDSDDGDEGDPRLMLDANQEPVPPTEAFVQVGRPTLRNALQSMNVTNVEALDTVPSTVDEPVFRISATDVLFMGPSANMTQSNVTMIVSESGHIVEYYHEFAYIKDGERITGTVRLEYRVFGVQKIDPPAWVPNTTADRAPIDEHRRPAPRSIETNGGQRPSTAPTLDVSPTSFLPTLWARPTRGTLAGPVADRVTPR